MKLVAKYVNATKPMSKRERTFSSPSPEGQVRDRWKRIGTIAHRAGSDDTSSESESDLQGADEGERAKMRERKRQQKKDREQYAKIMGLEYFLEMVSGYELVSRYEHHRSLRSGDCADALQLLGRPQTPIRQQPPALPCRVEKDQYGREFLLLARLWRR